MPALAIQTKSTFPPFFSGDAPECFGQSEEARQICEDKNKVIVHLLRTETYSKSAEIEAVTRLLKNGSGYATLSFITRKTRLRVEDFEQLVFDTSAFRKSLITTKDGGDVYCLNTPFSWLTDLWKAFCYVNALKYE